MKDLVFEKRNAELLSDVPSIIKQFDNAIHNSTKLTPNLVSQKVNEKLVFSFFQEEKTNKSQILN